MKTNLKILYLFIFLLLVIISCSDTDNNTAGFTIKPTSINTSETGSTATFTVKLNTRPDGDVVIDVVSSDTTEGTVDKSSLTFTSNTWNSNQTVTVTGVDDNLYDGDQDYTIQLTINGNTTDTTSYGSLNPDDVSAVNANDLNLSDTGQTTSYTDTFGEDHDYLINSPTFTDNSDDTVTDNNTGLIWQKKNDDTPRNWSDAGSYCDTLTLNSQTDWRLPDRRELMSIVNYGVKNPSIDTTFFPNTYSSGYWSSTIDAGSQSSVWGVKFSYGNVKEDTKTSKYYVRCVRGGQ